MSEASERDRLCRVALALWQRNLVGALEGNLSVRLRTGNILCTPTGEPKQSLTPAGLVTIDEEGLPIEGGRPSSEIKLHVRIYRERPDCQAIIHAHPLVATGFALAGKTLPDNLMPEAANFLGPVALVPFGYPGTDEVPDGIAPFLANHKTFLLQNHGAVVLGKDLDDAYHRMETLERIATVMLVAQLVGKPAVLPDEAYQRMAAGLLHGRL